VSISFNRLSKSLSSQLACVLIFSLQYLLYNSNTAYGMDQVKKQQSRHNETFPPSLQKRRYQVPKKRQS